MNQIGIDKLLCKKKDSAVIMIYESSIKIEGRDISVHQMLLLQVNRLIASVESIGRTSHPFLWTLYLYSSAFRK